MSKKTKNICLVSMLLTSAVAVGVFAYSAATQGYSNIERVKSADNWTEKAYQAPTGTEVGYKHYYLGCPGNERSLDALHEIPVTLAEITIPELDVIDASEVAEGSQILKVRNEKIRWVDQCTTLGSDGGTPVYVEDDGHQAVFFSRSNNLTDAHASEFRFTPGGTMNGLTSVTFDYRYLDYNTAVETGVSERHIYTQFHTSTYVNAYFDFVNDDEWHSATIFTDASTRDGSTEFLFNIFDFQGHIYISNLKFNGFNELDLEPASPLDAIAPITLSDLGIVDGTTVTLDHVIKDYNYSANKGIDLWFGVDYTLHTLDDSYALFYLFNNWDASGICFRFNYTRHEDDGIVGMYIFTELPYGEGTEGSATTVKQGAGNDGTFFWLPRPSGVKSSTYNIFHIFAYCIDDVKNVYRCGFTAGVEGGTQFYPSSDAEDKTNTPLFFDIELGDKLYNKVRFTSISSDLLIYNSDSLDQIVAYKDADGTLIGKAETDTIKTFDYQKADKKFVGWFDQNGQKVTDGQKAEGKTVIQPLFVENQSDMIVPSDIMMGTKGEWFNVNSSTITADETASGKGYQASGNRVDMYFIYQSTAFFGNDNWAKFGFPYDFLDAQSRLIIRINENNNGRLDGYVSGGSLGDEGASGTYFNLGYTFRKTGDLILIHLTVVDNGSNNISFTLECTNIRTREVGSVDYSVTFQDYSAEAGAFRNKMCLMPAVGCEWRFVDAF